MYRSLGTVDRMLERMPGGTGLLATLADAEVAFLDRVHVQHLSVDDTAAGVVVEAWALFDGELSFAVPGFPALVLVVGAGATGYTALRGEAVIAATSRLRLDDLGVTIRLDTPLLRPVALDAATPVLDHFEVQLRGSFVIDTDLNIDATLDGFNMPPFTVVGTGLVLAVEDCSLELSDTATSPAVTALGFGPEFKGVHARHAVLRWLPQATFDGIPGFRVALTDVVVGNQGVSFELTQTWQLDHTASTILPTSELAGEIFDSGWQLGLTRIRASVHHNVPTELVVAGKLRVPLLDTLFDIEFGLRTDGGSTTTVALSHSGAASVIDLGAGSLHVRDLQVDGVLHETGFTVDGSLSGTLDIDPFLVDLERGTVRVKHNSEADTIEMALIGMNLGPLGQVDQATLRIVSVVEALGARRNSASIEVSLRWADLRDRLNLSQLPNQFPLPPDEGQVTALLSWEDDGAGGHTLVVRFGADVADVDALWRFVPSPFRPRVDQFSFAAEVRYASAADFTASGTANNFQATVGAEVAARVPSLPPALDAIKVTTGGSDGIINARLDGGTDSMGQPYLKLSITDPVGIEIDLPGMAQPQPFLLAEITAIDFDLAPSPSFDGALALTGGFALRPIEPPQPPALVSHLQALFDPVSLSDLTGTAELALRFRGDRAALTLTGNFHRADIDIDVFGMLQGLASGLGIPAGVDEPKGSAPLELDVGVGLRGLRVQFGTLDAGPDVEQFVTELAAELRVGPLQVPTRLRLSDRELALGLDAIDIPLRLPKLPLPASELTSLTTDAAWEAQLDVLTARISALPSPPSAGSERARLTAARALLEQIFAIRQQLRPTKRVGYDDGVRAVVGLLEATTGIVPDSNVALALRDVRIAFPFADPRNIQVAGGGHLTGFAPGDPLKVLEGLQLGLGISADTVFFSLQGTGPAIRLPDLGRYPGGSVDISRLTLGYGFTRNSFSMNFQGHLVLPSQLIADADTSEMIGAGIRLPEHTRLGFRFDLIPIPGPIPVAPLLEFDLDLRTPGSPGLARSDRCEPFWDGLQLRIPDLIEAGIKHAALSPTFGVLPIPNLRFDGDLMLGDDRNGLTVVVDDLLVLLGIAGTPPIPVPLLADPTAPYVENLCVNVRLAGFGVNFNVQRPFPSLSPLALFEVLGLINDPMMPIDPRGSLANTMRASLTDAVITVPPAVKAVLPEAALQVTKPINVTINLGTFLSALQATATSAEALADVVTARGTDLEERIEELLHRPPAVAIGQVLAALPPEMRKVRLGGKFAGFDARVVLLLIDANDAQTLQRELDRRDGPAPAAGADPALRLGYPVDPEALSRFRPNMGTSRSRVHHPDDPATSLFNGIEFAAFTTADLAAIPAHRDAGHHRRTVPAGVVVGAHVNVYHRQRVRFLGFLFEDGSFGMVSAVDVGPLRFSVAGIPVELPFTASGRMALTGRVRRDGSVGSVVATGAGAWTIVPGLLRVEVGGIDSPARLAVHHDGTFQVAGSGRLVLWNGALEVRGSVDISESHCFIDGSFQWKTSALHGRPVMELALSCRGRVGPGRGPFALTGAGSMKVLGYPFLRVSSTVTEHGASVTGQLATSQWVANNNTFPCSVNLALRGEVDLAKRTVPSFTLDGEGSINVFGAEVRGRGGLRARHGELSTFVEGALRWHGRDWLSGRVELGPAGVRLNGNGSLALDLTPSNLSATELAHLHFRLDVQADFRLDPSAGLTAFTIAGSWQLGAMAAATSQLFPLAAQNIEVDGQAVLEVELIDVSGFALVPLRDFQSISVPVPVFKPSTPPPMIQFGTGPVVGVGSAIGLRWGSYGLGGDLRQGRVEGSLPLSFTASLSNTTLTLPFDLTSAFRVALVWQANRLQLKITRGNVVRMHAL